MRPVSQCKTSMINVKKVTELPVLTTIRLLLIMSHAAGINLRCTKTFYRRGHKAFFKTQ